MITCAKTPRKRTGVTTFIWNTFSVLEAKAWAQVTFLQVKDSLPLIELRPAWLISVYSHSFCKRSLPSPQRCWFACNGAAKWPSSPPAQFSPSPSPSSSPKQNIQDIHITLILLFSEQATPFHAWNLSTPLLLYVGCLPLFWFLLSEFTDFSSPLSVKPFPTLLTSTNLLQVPEFIRICFC